MRRKRNRWARLKAWLSHRGRRMARARWRKERAERAANPPTVDADTLRWRARDDARGTVLREGATYRADGVTTWYVRRALRGRVNQVEIVVNGRPWRRCSIRRALRLIGLRNTCALDRRAAGDHSVKSDSRNVA